jgi:hypothetical protein
MSVLSLRYVGLRKVKYEVPALKLIKQYAMKTCGVVDVQSHVFFTSALFVSGLGPSASPPGKEPPEDGWGRRAGLDYMERRKIFPLPGLQLRPLGRSARSQSRYPGFTL